MPLNVEVEIQGLDELVAEAQRRPGRIRQLLSEAVYDCAGILANAVRASQKTPVDTGFMLNKVGHQRVGKMGAVMFVATRYAVVVHQGIETDIPLAKPVNVYMPGIGWRRISVIKARPARPFIEWALKGGAQKLMDDRMRKALADSLTPG